MTKTGHLGQKSTPPTPQRMQPRERHGQGSPFVTKKTGSGFEKARYPFFRDHWPRSESN